MGVMISFGIFYFYASVILTIVVMNFPWVPYYFYFTHDKKDRNAEKIQSVWPPGLGLD